MFESCRGHSSRCAENLLNTGIPAYLSGYSVWGVFGPDETTRSVVQCLALHELRACYAHLELARFSELLSGLLIAPK
jgi:hypothetical protein